VFEIVLAAGVTPIASGTAKINGNQFGKVPGAGVLEGSSTIEKVFLRDLGDTSSLIRG
jgi:hypothetical protein